MGVLQGRRHEPRERARVGRAVASGATADARQARGVAGSATASAATAQRTGAARRERAQQPRRGPSARARAAPRGVRTVRFLGCTQWSDFMAAGAQELERTMAVCARLLNDYHATASGLHLRPGGVGSHGPEGRRIVDAGRLTGGCGCLAQGADPRSADPGGVAPGRRPGRGHRGTARGRLLPAPRARRPAQLQPRVERRLRPRPRHHRLHARPASRLRRRPHRRDRQHDAQAHGRRPAPAQRRVLLLARPLDDRLRARRPGRGRRARASAARSRATARRCTRRPGSSARRCRAPSSS